MSDSPDTESPDDEDVDAEVASEEADGDTEVATEEKSTLISLLASWFFPGLGHFYVESHTKGIVFAILALISYTLIFVGIGFFTTPVLVLIAAYDAYRETEAYNEAA